MKSFSVFFLPNNKPFGRAVCDTEETMKTSAITVQRATKFIALLRPLHINTKIHTCALDIFLLRKICCRAGSKEAFLKVGTLSVKARAYPRQIKTNNEFLKCRHIAAIVLLWKYCHSHSFSHLNFRTRFKHAHSFCRCVDDVTINAKRQCETQRRTGAFHKHALEAEQKF